MSPCKYVFSQNVMEPDVRNETSKPPSLTRKIERGEEYLNSVKYQLVSYRVYQKIVEHFKTQK
jgi:hypothetical protein